MRIIREIFILLIVLNFCLAGVSYSADEQVAQTDAQPAAKTPTQPETQAVIPAGENPGTDGIEYYQIMGDKDFSGYAQYDHLTQRVTFVVNNDSDRYVNVKSATYAANVGDANNLKIYALKFEQLEMNSSYDNKTYLVNPGGACRLTCIVPQGIVETKDVRGYYILVPNQYGWFDREIRFGYQVGVFDDMLRFWKNLRLKLRKIVGLR